MSDRVSLRAHADALKAQERDEERAVLNRRVASLTSQRDRALADLADMRRTLNLMSALDAEKTKPPRWLAPPTKGTHHATVNLLITDTHFDEVVRPEEVDGINAYNREIAEIRLEAAFKGAWKLARKYLSGVTYDGVCLMLGGDIFSGLIHEELKETNESDVIASVVHWIEPLEAGINLLAEEFGKVHVVGVPGNHGRNTRKPRFKGRATDNFDWLLYKLIERDFEKRSDVTVQVGNAMDAHVQVYNTRYLLTHGDQFKGGSGISGALSPLMLGAHRKTRRQSAAGKPYDVMVMGHFHHELSLLSQGLLVGPCLKGYDEFAYGNNFPPSPPAQALWITTPGHGPTFSAPVFVMDRKREKW
jgi:UDP-2,3-diacylglucosamine pyrophosphatase LpxH